MTPPRQTPRKYRQGHRIAAGTSTDAHAHVAVITPLRYSPRKHVKGVPIIASPRCRHKQLGGPYDLSSIDPTTKSKGLEKNRPLKHV